MRTIAHISDIHFGKEDFAVVDRLIEKIGEDAPDLIVVSGDLTQRAKTEQFIAARSLLDRLPKPQIVVPGNHDVPMYNVYDRFLHPLDKYKKYITNDMMPLFCDEEMAVLGVNTARSLTIKGGRISDEQVAEIRLKLDRLSDQKLKIIVTHHPFDLPEGFDEDDIVGRAKEVMPAIADSGADVFLAGHLHVSNITHSARRYRLENGHSALIIQAGTAASVRVRGETNSFNLLEYEYPILTVKRFECATAANGFKLAASDEFTQSTRGWARL